jgi:hypothetical protein
MTGDLDKTTERVSAALQDAKADLEWPEQLDLPVVVTELDLWAVDGRQWTRGSRQSWVSLLDDLVAALKPLGAHTRDVASVPALRSEAEACRGLIGADESRFDPALRQRLARLAATIRERFIAVETRLALWADLVEREDNHDGAVIVARQLLALATWWDRDRDGLLSALQGTLHGSVPYWDKDASPPAEERLAAAEAILQREPRSARLVMWFRYLLAPVQPNWLDIGESVRIYRGDWLRSCIEHVQNHPDLPEEARTDSGATSLDIFLGERGRPRADDDKERPVAYVRIDLGVEAPSRAVEVATDTAQAIASLGVLHGADANIWLLDDSWVMFADGEYAGGSTGPVVVEEPTFDQRIAVHQDRTSEGIGEVAERFGSLLPVRDRNVHSATTLLGWLRAARGSPGPVQIVLFDRVIESVAGWAGVNSMHRFVRDELIPWWAYRRIREVVYKAGFHAVHGSVLRYPEGSPEREAHREIEERANLRVPAPDGRSSINLRTVIQDAAWLRERVPPNSDAHRHLSRLTGRLKTGRTTLAWWDELERQARIMESRRFRTRNALVHGGPLAPETIAAIGAFAEHIAGEALASSIEGRLLQRDLVDHFLARGDRVRSVRARLDGGDPPEDALFFEDDV